MQMFSFVPVWGGIYQIVHGECGTVKRGAEGTKRRGPGAGLRLVKARKAISAQSVERAISGASALISEASHSW